MATKKIELTNANPVNIDPAAWPVIARAADHDGKVESQANNEWRIIVREHRDGRRLVYGMHDAGNGGQYAGFRPTRAGHLVAHVSREEARQPEDGGPIVGTHPDLEATVEAIRDVASAIGRADLGAECIGDLPALTLL